MKKRRRLFLHLIWPFAIFFWLIGWGFYCIQMKRTAKLEEKTAKQRFDFVTVLVPEAKPEAQRQKFKKQSTD